jgi:hypothetical protein
MPQRPGTPSEADVASRLRAMSPAEYQHLIGTDPILSGMVKHNIPITRDNYVDIANAGRPDEAWTHEHEAGLPAILRNLDEEA